MSAIDNSLQSAPDLHQIPRMTKAYYPSYMLNNPAVMQNEENNVKALQDYFVHSVKEGYYQSHPYDQMHLGNDMRIDELASNNTFMKLIFGGQPDKYDNINLAYNHSIRQMAESPVEKDSIVDQQNPLKFVAGAECDKDAVLKTFAEQRQFYKGAVDTDVERFLKSRPTHNLIATTFYNKKANSAGQSLRYNHVRGANDLIYESADTIKNFYPQENLSSRTFAPDGKGGRVPLKYENIYGPDARLVPISDEARFPAPEPIQEFSASDLGLYYGNEIDRYVFNFAQISNPSFANLFEQYKARQ